MWSKEETGRLEIPLGYLYPRHATGVMPNDHGKLLDHQDQPQ